MSKAQKTRLLKIIHLLKKYYPDARCELNYKNPLELLIAVILSAQCTDKRVNLVTPSLFKKYKSAKDYMKAPLGELSNLIYSTGFFKSKALRIKNCCKKLVSDYGGEVPSQMESLLSLSGVGRKTANVILGEAFQIPSGVVVDTHAGRLARRLGFTKSFSPEEIEKTLNHLMPKKFWIFWSHAIIHHGRKVCQSRRPLCEKCFLSEYCPKAGVEKGV